jgi:hypothetical protein
MMDELPWGGGFLGWCSSNLFWILFLVVLAAMLWWVSRKANRQMKQAMAAQDQVMEEQERAIQLTETAIEISRDTNRVLREILDVLRHGSKDDQAPDE